VGTKVKGHTLSQRLSPTFALSPDVKPANVIINQYREQNLSLKWEILNSYFQAKKIGSLIFGANGEFSIC